MAVTWKKLAFSGDAITAAQLPAATTSEQGAVELATEAEQQAGTLTDRACVPAYLALRKIGSGWALGTGGDNRGTDAVDLGSRGVASQVASGLRATVVGGYSNTASGTNATVCGGASNMATAEGALVVGGDACAATDAYAVVIGGGDNVAGGPSTVVVGGHGNVADGNSASVLGGYDNEATGDYSSAVGYGNLASGFAALAEGAGNTASGYGSHAEGYGNTASGDQSHAEGLSNTVSGLNSHAEGSYGTVSAAESHVEGSYSIADGEVSHAQGFAARTTMWGQDSQAAGKFSAAGDAQTSVLVARRTTTNATPSALFLDGDYAISRLVIATNTTWAFRILVAARRTDAADESAAYEFLGCIDRNTNATALVGTVTTWSNADNVDWDVAVTADDANDALIVTVTGEAAKTIRWVARIELTEVSN